MLANLGMNTPQVKINLGPYQIIKFVRPAESICKRFGDDINTN
jgi:hypothetical protein